MQFSTLQKHFNVSRKALEKLRQKVDTVAKTSLKAFTTIPKVSKVVKLLIEVVDEA